MGDITASTDMEGDRVKTRLGRLVKHDYDQGCSSVRLTGSNGCRGGHFTSIHKRLIFISKIKALRSDWDVDRARF